MTDLGGGQGVPSMVLIPMQEQPALTLAGGLKCSVARRAAPPLSGSLRAVEIVGMFASLVPHCSATARVVR